MTDTTGAWEDADEPVTELTEQECWDLVADERFGRLAYRLVDEVHLVPVNHVVDDGVLLFRTAAGGKLLAAALHSEVAFEVDRVEDRVARSVVVHGRLQRVPEDEAHRADELGLWSWVPTLKYDVVRLEPAVVSGRRLRLERTAARHG
ncbi:pyridoxamine 5'-phosphate oxidase family protein [Nocardioides sp. OK12]|uniref:pyridoxamine 5'-phosphate oxidase family protein n=1 Tax=Nocardioides sp. OK12 TaxID=2758661 RepID=UPI0021C30077|nr:pyridoxamine 5'-phosphate oxidase family protein [Nocardioides sp. OK12]